MSVPTQLPARCRSLRECRPTPLSTPFFLPPSRSGVDGVRDRSGDRVAAALRRHGRRAPLRVQEAEDVLQR